MKDRMIAYVKWLNSTKFQVCILAMTLIYSAVPLYRLNPEIMVKSVETLTLAYFGARMFEPVVERIVDWLANRKKNAEAGS